MLSDECIEDEIPFEIPESWEWVRLRDLADFAGGKTPSTSDKSNYEDNGILWVTSKDMKRDFIDSTLITLSKKGASDLTLFKPGTILMVARSGILRRMLPVAMLKEAATINQDQKAICPFDVSVSLWLLVYLKASDIRIRRGCSKAGTTVESIVFGKVKTLLVPIPPLAEQRHIAERVSELVSLVEEYGKLGAEREALDTALPDRLRKSILQQAVQGRLAPQDPADEPASVLLGRIREERRRLIAEGRLKAPKGGESVIYRASDGSYYEKRVDAKGRGGEPVCIDDEIPFEIPDSWEWVRISSIGEVVGGGTPKTHDASLWGCKEHGIAWVTPADMKHVKGIYVEAGERYISDEGLSSSSARLLPIGSVLMSSRAPIGYVAIASAPIATNQGFKSIVPYIAGMSLWLYWVIQSRMDNIKERATGTTFKEISGNEFGMTLIPLPPCKEQFDICSSIKKLLEIATNQ